MGTFHQGKGDLHGITVVVDTDGDEIFIGRCDDIDDHLVILLDVDVHRDGDGGRSKEQWVEQAARYGAWSRHPRVAISRARVESVRRLGDL